ncbi:MAG: hypothetical protein AAF092_04500 [Pseudomonadota bacterium]
MTEPGPRDVLLDLAALYGVRDEVAALVRDRAEPKLYPDMPRLLRAAKRISGLTIPELSERGGYSRSLVKDRLNISPKNVGVRTLADLSTAFSIPLGLLFAQALKDTHLSTPAPGSESLKISLIRNRLKV